MAVDECYATLSYVTQSKIMVTGPWNWEILYFQRLSPGWLLIAKLGGQYIHLIGHGFFIVGLVFVSRDCELHWSRRPHFPMVKKLQTGKNRDLWQIFFHQTGTFWWTKNGIFGVKILWSLVISVHCGCGLFQDNNVILPSRHEIVNSFNKAMDYLKIGEGMFTVHWLCRVMAGFPRLLQSPGFFSWKFQDLESLGQSLWSWKVLEKIVESHVFF